MEKIGLDMDGVLYPWNEALYTYFRIYKGFSGTQFEFSKILPLGRDSLGTLDDAFIGYLAGIEYLYGTMIPLKSMLESLRRIAKTYEVFYITARPKNARITTEKYLNSYGFPFPNNLILSRNKGVEARVLGLSFFVDDKPKHLDQISKETISFLFLQPWNEAYKNKYPTIRSIQELEEILL